MKYKIITDGKQYRICAKFLWWWDKTTLPPYVSVEECKAAIFRVWGDSPQNIIVENLNNTQHAKGCHS